LSTRKRVVVHVRTNFGEMSGVYSTGNARIWIKKSIVLSSKIKTSLSNSMSKYLQIEKMFQKFVFVQRLLKLQQHIYTEFLPKIDVNTIEILIGT